jgi:Hypothetical glycosyl hydrolase family 15
MSRVISLAIWAALFVCAQASAFDKPPFPRLGANWIANQNYQDPAIQSQLARGNIAIIGVWPGWENGRGTTVEQVIKNIKAINPRTLVFNYINNNEVPTDRSAYADWAPLYAKLDSAGWYLYANGGCCAQVSSTWPGAVILNNTLLAPTDSNGDRWVDWYAKWAVTQYSVPNPSLDGLNTDNVFWKPRVDGDWNRDGNTDSASNPTVQSWFRQGYAHHFSVLNKLMPGKLQIGNVADWGDPNSALTEYQGVLNGGVMEGMLGYSYSVETWGGWQVMMAWYRKTMNALGEPKLGLFHQVGSATDYQSVRYGLTSTLMDDGYYVFNTTAGQGGDAPWFDEYKAALGNSTSAPATTAWQNGVYRRDFENGIALVNPKGNGAKTITLEGDFKRLSGTQVPTINSGQTVRTLTLQDRDGIILLRLTPTKIPQAPSGLRLQN